MKSQNQPTKRNQFVKGFTLVELLVVIAIIGILIAMLLPAIQAAREAARRMSCSSNVRQVAMACHNYLSVYNEFPPGYGFQKSYGKTRLGDPEWPWCIRLLPYLEQTSLYDEIDYSFNPGSNAWTGSYGAMLKHITEAPFPMFRCPCDSLVRKPFNDEGVCAASGTLDPLHRHGRINYAGNFGWGNLESGSQGTDTPGVRIHGVFRYNRSAKIAEITDGTSNTLLLMELTAGNACTMRTAITYDEGPVCMVNFPPNDATPDRTRWCDKKDGQDDGATNTCYHRNGALGGVLTVQDMVLHTSRSYHPGGVNVALADTSVRFVDDSVDLEVWKAVGTPAGEEIFKLSEL